MRVLILLLCLFLGGCATSRTTVIVSGEVEGVRVAAIYELGGNHAGAIASER